MGYLATNKIKRLPKRAKTDPIGEGVVSKSLDFALGAWDLPKVNFKDPNDIKERALLYFTKCKEHDIKPCVEGLSMYFGVDRTTFLKERTTNPNPACLEQLERAYFLLNNLQVDYMQNNEVNVVGSIFLLKNNYGYKDDTRLQIEAMPTNKEFNVSDDELKSKYFNTIQEDAIDVEVTPTKEQVGTTKEQVEQLAPIEATTTNEK